VCESEQDAAVSLLFRGHHCCVFGCSQLLSDVRVSFARARVALRHRDCSRSRRAACASGWALRMSFACGGSQRTPCTPYQSIEYLYLADKKTRLVSGSGQTTAVVMGISRREQI